MKENRFTRRDYIFLIIILFTAFIFRLYKITIPLADFHSWRQVDTASVARNFIANGFDLLHPTYHDLSNIQSGTENPNGYRMVEFPLYNALFAYTYKLFPFASLETHGRFVSLFFSLIIIAILYYFLKKEVSTFAAFSGSLIYAIFPFFVFFSRVVLPETMALSLAFISLFLLYSEAETKERSLKTILSFFASSIFFSAAMLVKPTVIFFAASMLYLFFKKYRYTAIKQLRLYAFFAIALIPFIAWRLYIKQYPEGIPLSNWLITYVQTSQGKQPIFLRPAFFRWIFFERINNSILGGFAAGFFVLGILVKQKKLFLHSILASSILYLFTFQGGNVQHEYYQILILPSVAIFTAIGIPVLFQNRRYFFHPVISSLTILVVFMFSFFISYYRVKNYYSVSADLLTTATIVSTLTSPEDKIVTDTIGDTTLLYLAKRKGSPAVFKDLELLKKDGYRYFVTSKKDVVEEIKKKTSFQAIFENDQFTLFRL